jgi:hypothetical protein
MRHATRYRPSILVAGLLLALSACSDSAPIAAPGGGSTSALGQTLSSPGDTALTATPFVPSANVDLAITVGAAVAGQDSLQSTPLASTKVTVFSRKLVATPGGADSLTVSETVVADATTDASGQVRFAGLPSVAYRVAALGTGGSASVTLAPPYPAAMNIRLIIR